MKREQVKKIADILLALEGVYLKSFVFDAVFRAFTHFVGEESIYGRWFVVYINERRKTQS